MRLDANGLQLHARAIDATIPPTPTGVRPSPPHTKLDLKTEATDGCARMAPSPSLTSPVLCLECGTIKIGTDL